MKSISPASINYSAMSGDFDMTDYSTVQCIPIQILSDGTSDNRNECFTYTISATSIVAGLTLSPTTATICISEKEECKCHQLMLTEYIVSHIHYCFSVTVSIGLQQVYYSAVEGQGSAEVCIAVLNGNITRSSFTVSYTTIDGLAEGM